jgi:hypothetical protein
MRVLQLFGIYGKFEMVFVFRGSSGYCCNIKVTEKMVLLDQAR